MYRSTGSDSSCAVWDCPWCRPEVREAARPKTITIKLKLQQFPDEAGVITKPVCKEYVHVK